MPAAKKPPDPKAGAASAFAYGLYQLWTGVATPPLREMALAVNLSHSSLSRAMKGDRVPTWETTKAFVTACAGDLVDWERRWQAAKTAETTEKRAAKAAAAVAKQNAAAAAARRAAQAPTIPIAPIAAPVSRPVGATTPRTPAPQPRHPHSLRSPRNGTADPKQDQRHGQRQPPSPSPTMSVAAIGDGVRALPPLRMPIREGVAEHLTNPMLLQALQAPSSMGLEPLEALARALNCDVATAAECLIHSVLALRGRNSQLQRRLAAQHESSPFFPPDSPATPHVRLVPDGQQLKVRGQSSRPPGSHRLPAPDGVASFTPLVTVSETRKRGQHNLAPDASMLALHTRRALPVTSIAEATGTDSRLPSAIPQGHTPLTATVQPPAATLPTGGVTLVTSLAPLLS